MLHPLRYAAQHGFELVVAQNLQHGRTARWDKVMLLRQLLRKYEWLHWVDLDTLFMNLKRHPNEFLDPAFDLHVAKVNPNPHHHSPLNLHPNSKP